MVTGALTVICKKCKALLPLDAEKSGALSACPSCAEPYRIDVFPRVQHREQSKDPVPIDSEDQARCFFHEKFQAAIPCDGCGRFLCQLCDINFQGGHRCISCIEQMKKEKSSLLVNSETRWGNLAKMSLVMSLPFWFLSFVTIPVGMFLFFKLARGKDRVLKVQLRETLVFIGLTLVFGSIALLIWGALIMPLFTQ